MPVLLSICIPTHDGRRATLEQAIDSVLSQFPLRGPGEVQVCVSDNVSEDGTEELIRELQSCHGDVISYRRNRVNVGGPLNLRNSVEMAQGRWCWLLSSDDALAPGALDAVMGVLERHPDASGITLGWRAYDRLLEAELPADRTSPPFNVGGRERAFGDAVRVFAECGAMFDYMSIHVFQRELWTAAVARLDQSLLARTYYPTTYVLGRICLERPVWIWSAADAVRARAATHALTKRGEADTAALRACALADVQRVWAGLLGGDRALRRRIGGQWVASYARPDDLRGDRTNRATRWKSQLALLARIGSAVGWSPPFWRETFPILIVPGALGRLASRVQGRFRPSARLRPEACRIRVRADEDDLQAALARGRLGCTIENLGPVTLRSAPPYPVHLASRWFDRTTGTMVRDGERTRLSPVLRPGRSCCYTISLRRPPPGDYVLRVSLVQEHVAWFDDLAPENGWSRPLSVAGREH